MNILDDVFLEDNFFRVSKKLAQQTSNDAAILFAELYYKHKYFEIRQELNHGNSFFALSKDLQFECNLSRRYFDKAVEELKAVNVISTYKFGLPARTYYKIDFVAIKNLLNNTKLIHLSEEKDENDVKQPANPHGYQNGVSVQTGLASTYNNNKKQVNKKQSITNDINVDELSDAFDEYKEDTLEVEDNELFLYNKIIGMIPEFDKFTISSKDREFISKIKDYRMDSYLIASKILQNYNKVLKGKAKSRFGNLFVGLDIIDGNNY